MKAYGNARMEHGTFMNGVFLAVDKRILKEGISIFGRVSLSFNHVFEMDALCPSFLTAD